MGQIRSTVKLTIIITSLVIITFFTFVGLTRQEWMGTVFPEEPESKMLRIEDHEERIKTEQSQNNETTLAKTDEARDEERKVTIATPTSVKFKGRNFKNGDIIRLYNIYFDLDKSELNPSSNEELLTIINLLKKYPNLHVEISGHTSKTRSREYSINLSKKRADSVFEFIVSRGIDRARLEIAGYGFEKPISTKNDSLDRRVEFKILKI